MSAEELLYEGYLRKRKDRMKLKWVKYWFKLENTTLFFYSKKDGNPTHLKGQYYLYTVESVREVQRAENKRYVFEINMKNGKKKLLAAESACLRQCWLQCLWRAMQLPDPALQDSTPSYRPDVDDPETAGSERESMNSHHSTFAQWSIMETCETQSCEDVRQRYAEEEESEYQVPPTPRMSYLSFRHSSQSLCSVTDPEEDYYKCPRGACSISGAEEEEEEEEGVENIYDVPLSCREARREAAESIYDVPRALLRQITEQSLALGDERSEESVGLV